MRTRAVPITPSTQPFLQATARMASATAGWQNLTDDQRAAWKAYTQTHPVFNALGQSVTLSGHQAYVGITCRLDLASTSAITDPPTIAQPEALDSITVTYDIGAGTSTIAYTTTPLAANHHLWVLCAVTSSPGVEYVKNLYKLIHVSAAALASPYDWESDAVARFGTIVVGQKVHFMVMQFSAVTGLLSAPRIASGVVVST